MANLRSHFSAKVILVNHEAELAVDTQASNLAIKYNMMYLSVYQMIKQAIQSQSATGKALVASRKTKPLAESAVAQSDEFQEDQFSAVHYDMELVIKMIQSSIAQKRTTQQFIILEGLCNNRKLKEEDEKLALRYMDELFQIEKHIGEVSAVISLQYAKEDTQFKDEKWEEFEPEPVVEVKKPKLDENGDPIEEEEEAAEEEAEPKKPAWNPAIYKWTVTNRRAKNLP